MKTPREILENQAGIGKNCQPRIPIDQALTNLDLSYADKYKASVPSVLEMSEVTAELVEEHFPKGECKERGQAIVLHALMLIAIHKLIEDKCKEQK